MPLEHGDTPRLTTEQRDRVLDLAARLQAQHESTVAVDDLAEAAAEAGIEKRFVQEAVRSLEVEAQPDLSYRLPLGLFVAQAVAFMLQKDITVSAWQRPLILHEAVVAAMIAFALAAWASQSRANRSYVVVVPPLVWTTVGIAASFYMNQKGLIGAWIPGFATLYGAIQTGAGVLGLLFTTLLAPSRPEPSFRAKRQR